MAVDEERSPGREAWGHEGRLPGIEPDQDEALPGRPAAFRIGMELVKEGPLELEDFLHVHAGDEGLGGGGGRIAEDDVLELVGTGGNNGGTLVNLGGVEKVED